MNRLYFLTQDINRVEIISHDIHNAEITDWNFHVLSKNEKGLYSRHIHSANILQKTDIIRSLERGVLRGAVIGAGLALILSLIPIHGSTLSFSTLVILFLASIILGGWQGNLSGYQNENHKIKPFHDKIEQGYFVIMIDVPTNQIAGIKELMQSKHPEVHYCDQGTTITLPFDKSKEVCF